MIDINWNNFKAKYDGKESKAFETLAYMLFCYEFGIKIGIFRFKNQTGIETEPINVEGRQIGFQAKYYDTKLAANKEDIVDSLKKAKAKNENLSKVLIYTNQELSESPKKNKKKPDYLIDIEQAVSELELEVDWRVPSYFEKQLSVPENDYLARHYFDTQSGVVEFLEKMKLHSANTLFPIQTNISFKNQEIKLDRNEIVDKLAQAGNSTFILAGEGGCGKTAVVKEMFLKQLTPCYIFKAAEFAKTNLTDIFNQFGSFDFSDFLHFHSEELNKIFVVDSAERLSDLESQEVFIEFLSSLISHNWKIIFTTRNSYLTDLSYHLKDTYRLSFEIIRFENLNDEQLKKIAHQHHFQLPENPRLRSLICNLFYLNEYLTNYDEVLEKSAPGKFREILWNKKIQNSKYKKDNIHLEREKCFLHLARTRCESGVFFIKSQNCSGSILSLLEKDEVIRYETSQKGYFITHDIYEEWALDKLIEQEYTSLESYHSFFGRIGNSLPIRRAFRFWLSEKLVLLERESSLFIEQVYSDSNIPQFWKDELLISILLSEHSEVFFKIFESVLLINDKALLKRIVFLLRTACKEIDDILQLASKSDYSDLDAAYLFTKPKGSGWEVVVNFIYSKIQLISSEDLDVMLPLMKDWVNYSPKGKLAQTAGKFALHFYKDSELNKQAHYSSAIEKELLEVVLGSSAELIAELTSITEEFLLQPINRQSPFDNLREAVLKGNIYNVAYVINFPKLVIRMADLAWFVRKEDRHPFSSQSGVERHYSINDRTHHDYFPASALQTPVRLLFHVAFPETIDFILDFTNRTVESYFNSGFDKNSQQIDVRIGTDERKQIVCSNLWNIYRGSSATTTPYLLQSMHMALEKKLLQMAKHIFHQEQNDFAGLKAVLIHLLKETRSASISAVVTSVVLAYPDELFDIAIILFSNWQFVQCDNLRLGAENDAKRMYLVGRGINGRTDAFAKERLQTCSDEYRQLCLESLIIQYQFFNASDEQASQRNGKIWEVLDYLRNSVLPETKDNSSLRLLLARIDRRNMNPTVKQENGKIIIETNPDFDEDLLAQREEAQQAFQNTFKYSALNNWATSKLEKKQSGSGAQYDNNIKAVLLETKEIVEGLKNGNGYSFFMFDRSTPANTCAALITYYSDVLTHEDRSFCKDIIVDYAKGPFQDDYDYQISDGAEVAINALPYLYKLFPNEKDDFNSIFFFILFDSYPLGEYKRICDYAVEAIHEKLFSLSPDDAEIILLTFMANKPKYDLDRLAHPMYGERRSRAEIINSFIEKYKPEFFEVEEREQFYQKIDFSAQNIETADTILQMIPAETTDMIHLDYMKKTLERFSSQLLQRTRYSHDPKEIDYRLKQRFFKKFSRFLLARDLGSIQNWVQPFVEAFTVTDEMADFLSDVIMEETILTKYDSFWTIWDCFYSTIKSAALSANGHRGMDDIICNYLLAWPYWGSDKSWSSLRSREKAFFKKACSEMGQNTAVLYSIARLLNEVGSDFIDSGVFWIADMLETNANLHTDDLKTNTIYHLEKIARKYVYLNRAELKKNKILKDKILTLLNFLVNKGSINGYLLREDVL